MSKIPAEEAKWEHPKELLKLQKLKLKKQALQERINGQKQSKSLAASVSSKAAAFENIFNSKKRKNPFEKSTENLPKNKKAKSEFLLDESADQTLFKILNLSHSASTSNTQTQNTSVTSFTNILASNAEATTQVKKEHQGSPWCPVDWTLKRKMRLFSKKPFQWSQILKIGEEASGVTSFTRCLDIEKCSTSLDVSPNAKFHQCCLYWQHPYLPWLTLFPRSTLKNNSSTTNLAGIQEIKKSLYETWMDSLKSLFQLIRTRQCPYFYVCANNFTALFRAAGIFGYSDIHVLLTPTTRGFRNLLKEELIDFEMPLKPEQMRPSQGNKSENDEAVETEINHLNEEDDALDEEWMTEMGIDASDIKHINYTQARIKHKTDCLVDRSDQSLVLIEGCEVNAFFNCLLNCKSAIAPTGPLAGVPPTLLAPVCFKFGTLTALKVRQHKIQSEGVDYYSLDLLGPILPSTLHNILNINSPSDSITISFSDVESTRAYSKVVKKTQKKLEELEQKGGTIFGEENLSDCGLNAKILKNFCSADSEKVCNFELLKYCGETRSYTWT
ncbi:unnamed protein product [Ceutorhynchus assimilis]|uniref:Protein downstream neighbor of son homolog n=1 Tax=Ceutorhynchus assimilis TaxID=467358 RepID=A0A9N9MN53_9CUCU|nr:unnamed protein product [Ceutorhynchus assimilis]